MSDALDVGPLVEGLFRHSYGRMLAALTRVLGFEHLERAEDVVQDALLRALRHWRVHGVPDDPQAWLVRAARNAAIDEARRDASLRDNAERIRAWSEGALERSAAPAADDTLALMFACCQPSLAPDARTALTLKCVCGFSVAEIARAFLADEATITQRITRAKAKLREVAVEVRVPEGQELEQRIESVLEVLYLVGNEGLLAHQGAELVRVELVHEALRLALQLAALPTTERPQVHALSALLALQAARLPARSDEAGNLLVLEDQDRSLWDRRLLALGFRQLALAARGDQWSELHIEAGIAAQHAAAPTWAATDWPAILALYDQLLERRPSPVVALNRAVALAMVEGPQFALDAVEALAVHPALARSLLLPALQGELYRRVGDRSRANACYDRALSMPCSVPQRLFFERRRTQ